ncbi:MAG: cytochrome c [Xanthobacteraceae bacterium]
MLNLLLRRNAAKAGAAVKRATWPAVLLAAMAAGPVAPALAQQSPAAQRGLTFVRLHCAQCHSVDPVSDSPLKIALPFRTLIQQFPLETLRRRLAEGITATHPTMPQFRLEPDQLNDVMEYLQSLQR